MSCIIYLSCCSWVHVRHFVILIVNVSVECLAPVDVLVLVGSFLGAETKANGLGTIWVLGIATTRILVDLGRLLTRVHLLGHLDHVRGVDLVGGIVTLLTDRVSSGLHDLMNALVDVNVLGVDGEMLTVVNSGDRGVVWLVWNALRGREMILGALVIDELDISILT